jgi:hypothetical protein
VESKKPIGPAEIQTHDIIIFSVLAITATRLLVYDLGVIGFTLGFFECKICKPTVRFILNLCGRVHKGVCGSNTRIFKVNIKI